jgi:Na+/H+ antiporter NhaC
MTAPTLRFRGGKAMSAVPLLYFVAWAISICVAGAPDENGLILGAVIGITVGMWLCKDRWWNYAEEVMTGMANRVATVTILAWFWAGMFAQVLRAGGLVDGLVWLGGASHATGGVFAGATFVLAATFATAVGTGYGTTVACSPRSCPGPPSATTWHPFPIRPSSRRPRRRRISPAW